MSRRSVGTGLKRFDWGFAGSWVYLLRHAVNTSMWAHPKHPCFVRSKEVHPTPGELCEIERANLDRLSVVQALGLEARICIPIFIYVAAFGGHRQLLAILAEVFN